MGSESPRKIMVMRVKEIVPGFSDQEIHAMLEECDMDPNVAIQRLLAQELKKGTASMASPSAKAMGQKSGLIGCSASVLGGNRDVINSSMQSTTESKPTQRPSYLEVLQPSKRSDSHTAEPSSGGASGSAATDTRAMSASSEYDHTSLPAEISNLTQSTSTSSRQHRSDHLPQSPLGRNQEEVMKKQQDMGTSFGYENLPNSDSISQSTQYATDFPTLSDGLRHKKSRNRAESSRQNLRQQDMLSSSYPPSEAICNATVSYLKSRANSIENAGDAYDPADFIPYQLFGSPSQHDFRLDRLNELADSRNTPQNNDHSSPPSGHGLPPHYPRQEHPLNSLPPSSIHAPEFQSLANNRGRFPSNASVASSAPRGFQSQFENRYPIPGQMNYGFRPGARPNAPELNYGFRPEAMPNAPELNYGFRPGAMSNAPELNYDFRPGARPNAQELNYGFRPEARTNAQEFNYSFRPEARPNAPELNYGFRPGARPNAPELYYGFRPEARPNAPELNYGFRPEARPNAQELNYSFRPEARPNAQELNYGFRPEARPNAQEFNYSFRPEARPNAPELNYGFRPGARPNAPELNYGFRPEARPNAPELNYGFRPEVRPNAQELNYGFRPEARPNAQELNYGFRPEARPNAQEFNYSFRPEARPNAPELNYSFRPGARPNAPELNYGFRPEARSNAPELNYGFRPEARSNAQELNYGFRPEARPNAQELNYGFRPEARPNVQEQQRYPWHLANNWRPYH